MSTKPILWIFIKFIDGVYNLLVGIGTNEKSVAKDERLKNQNDTGFASERHLIYIHFIHSVNRLQSSINGLTILLAYLSCVYSISKALVNSGF